MRSLREEVKARLAGKGLAPTRELEVVREISQHLEDRQAELITGGLTEEAARAAVLAELDDHPTLARELGHIATLRARPPITPGAPRRGLVADFVHDVRFAVRGLGKSPGFATITLLSLALGVGATTSFFQLLDAIHLRSLPVEHAGELATVKIANRTWASGNFNGWHPDLSNPQWEAIRDRQEAFSGMFAWGDREFNLSPSGERKAARGLYVSGDFFRVLGVRPFLGRLIGPADDKRGCGAPGAVVSHGFWERQLGSDPMALDRTLHVEGVSVPIIGVTPPGFFGVEAGKSFDVAIPICMEGTQRGPRSYLDVRHSFWLSAIGRLKPGWTLEKATAHLAAISPGVMEATVPQKYPVDKQERYQKYELGAFPAGTGISELRIEYSKPLYVLLAIAALVLIIACANLANLLLARASVREREIAVRLALGASRWRLVRQLMTESLLLAIVGSGLGLLVATWVGGSLVGLLNTPGTTFEVPLDPQWRVLAFTAGLAALTCVLFGLAPALRASRTDIGLVLKAATQSTPGRERFTLRRVLVASQMALSFVLLVGALLFTRSLLKLVMVDPGFTREGVTILGVDMRPLKLPKEQIGPRIAEVLEKVRATPGVVAAASTSIVPVSGNGWNHDVWPEGQQQKDGKTANFSRISDGYFATMHTPLVAGRDFDARDNLSNRNVAIVNETLAREVLKDPNPVGKLLRREPASAGEIDPNDTLYEIIGVVKDSKYGDLREPFAPIVYVPLARDRDPWAGIDLVVRSNLPLADIAPSLKETIMSASPQISLEVDRLERLVRDSLLRERLMATLSGFFGLLAALLASVGLYGVVSYSVSRRTHEIGIRMALGANQRKVLRMIVRETFGLVLVGAAVGTILALAAARLAGAFLYGIPPHDPVAFGAALGLMAVVALLASLIPARRAARVDPMVALREE